MAQCHYDIGSYFGTVPLGYRGIHWHSATRVWRHTLAQCH